MTTAMLLDPAVLARVNGAIEDIRAGRMVILVDDEDRENEGDLVMAAQFCTPDAVNFMAKHARGLICLTLTDAQVDRLGLPMMQQPGRQGPPLGTAFTISIEAREGVSTGISAADRAHTMRVAANPHAVSSDVSSPGHVFPLRAREGGVLVRTGQTEGSVDLARLSGLTPAGVICEIMNDDGTMARMPDLEVFAAEHKVRILSVADLIQYRLASEKLVRRAHEREVILDTTGTPWKAIAYDVLVDGREFLALVKGDVRTQGPVLCRVHTGSVVGDLFASTAHEGGRRMREAIARIEAEGRGVLIYVPSRTPIATELEAQGNAKPAVATGDSPLREFGIGAQVLADLGVRELTVLTHNPRKIAGLAGFGLVVSETRPLG